MHDELLLDGEVAVRDVSDDVKGLQFAEPALLANVLLEVAQLAELSHEVDVVLGHEHLNSAQDVGMRERP